MFGKCQVFCDKEDTNWHSLFSLGGNWHSQISTRSFRMIQFEYVMIVYSYARLIVWQWNVCHTCHVWGLLNLSDQIAQRGCCSDLPVYSAPMHCNGPSWKLQTHLGLEIVETKPSSNQRAIRIESEPTKSTYFATFSPKYLSNNTIQTSAMTCKNHGHGLSILTWFESDVCHLMTKMQISEWGCKCASLGA